MPYITSPASYLEAAQAAIQARRNTRFMYLLRNGRDLLLYGSEKSCLAALIEATTDHPLAVPLQEIEYLPQEVLRTLAQPMKPIHETLRDLGRIDPDSNTPIT